MNKKGNMFFGITIALFIYIIGVLFIPFLVDDVDTFRTNMECSDASITDGGKIACLFGDLAVPYLIWFFVSITLGIIVGSIK